MLLNKALIFKTKSLILSGKFYFGQLLALLKFFCYLFLKMKDHLKHIFRLDN